MENESLFWRLGLPEIPYVPRLRHSEIAQQLLSAAQHGDNERIDQLLNDTSIQAPQLENVLFQAEHRNFTYLAERILSLPEPQNPAALNDNNAIIVAVLLKRHQILEKLLELPFVNPLDRQQMALIFAARSGDLDILNRILRVPGIDVTIHNHAVLAVAAHAGHIDIVDRLLQIPALDPTANGQNTALTEASFRGQELVVARLLTVPSILASLSAEPLHIAVQYNHVALLPHFLAIPGLLNNVLDSSTVLFIAIRHGSLKCLEALLTLPQVPASPCLQDQNLLLEAVRQQDLYALKALLNTGMCAGFLTDGKVLELACKLKRVRIVERLLEEEGVAQAVGRPEVSAPEALELRQALARELCDRANQDSN